MRGNNSAANVATMRADKRSESKIDGKVELRTLADFAFDPKSSTVGFHQVFRDREARPVPPTSRERATSTRRNAQYSRWSAWGMPIQCRRR